MPPPSGRNSVGDFTDGIKRWDLLVNATPVGQPPHETESLVTSRNFLRCFDRVLDLVPTDQPTLLTRLAEEANVPAIHGQRVFELQAEYSRELWVGEYRRRVDGRGAKPGAENHQAAPTKRGQGGSAAKS
jgi:shikimate 5-dehydrogenase